MANEKTNRNNLFPSIIDLESPRERSPRKATPYPKSLFSSEERLATALSDKRWNLVVQKSSVGRELIVDCERTAETQTPPVIRPLLPDSYENNVNEFRKPRKPPLRSTLRKSFSSPTFQLPKILLTSSKNNSAFLLKESSSHGKLNHTPTNSARETFTNNWRNSLNVPTHVDVSPKRRHDNRISRRRLFLSSK